MRKMVTVLLTAALMTAPVAGAYSIKHSYTAAGDATEYHGLCANGSQMVITEQTNGSWSYDGPAGDGTVSNGDMDKAAKRACGE